MRKKQQVLGMYVVQADTAAILGRVQGLELSADGRRVAALRVGRPGFTGRSGRLAFEDIALFGSHAVLARKITWQKFPTRTTRAVRVLDFAGNQVGTMYDYWFSTATGRVRQLELSRGVWEDLVYGRVCIQKFMWMEIGNEWVVCTDGQRTQ